MNEEEKIKIGKNLLRILAANYRFANRLDQKKLKASGISKDEVAYSCYSSEGVETLGLTPNEARECINSALIDLEEKYQFKPDLKPERHYKGK